MARTRTTNVGGYWTKRHYTKPHVRTLNDFDMQLELAEGTGTDKLFYYQVPDPENKRKPLFLIESEVWNMPDDEFAKFIRYVTPFNKPDYLARLIKRRMAAKPHLSEELLLSGGFWKKAFSVVKGVFKGAVAGVTGIQLPGGGTASVTTQPVVTTQQPVVVTIPPATPPATTSGANAADDKIFGLTKMQLGIGIAALAATAFALKR